MGTRRRCPFLEVNAEFVASPSYTVFYSLTLFYTAARPARGSAGSRLGRLAARPRLEFSKEITLHTVVKYGEATHSLVN